MGLLGGGPCTVEMPVPEVRPALSQWIFLLPVKAWLFLQVFTDSSSPSGFSMLSWFSLYGNTWCSSWWVLCFLFSSKKFGAFRHGQACIEEWDTCVPSFTRRRIPILVTTSPLQVLVQWKP